jgi:hypothetical protein
MALKVFYTIISSATILPFMIYTEYITMQAICPQEHKPTNQIVIYSKKQKT